MKAIVLICLLFPLCSVAQQPSTTAPIPPSNTLPAPPRPDPRAHWREATIALGQLEGEGTDAKFIVQGTAVIVSVDSHRGCLLTAKHMVANPTTAVPVPSLWMRLTSENGETQQPIKLSLYDAQGHPVWIGAPDGDLAVIPLPTELPTHSLEAVGIDEFAKTTDDVFQGAQVMVLGYPQVFRQMDNTNPYSTSPIARSGIIAWVDPANPLDKPFLIDANLYGGNSGGPVFRVRSGFDKYGNFSIGNVGYTFIGIVSQGAQTVAPIYSGNINNPAPLAAVVPFTGGIGAIEPASRARKLLERAYSLPSN